VKARIINLPIIDHDKEEVFRHIFVNTYLKHSITFEKYAIKFFPEDFKHLCYEYGKGGKYKEQFSLRRARRLLFIKEICEGNIPYILIHQIQRRNKSVCVLCESIDFALFLIPKTSSQGNYFRIGTIIAYGQKVESKIAKQKANGKPIKRLEEVFGEGC